MINNMIKAMTHPLSLMCPEGREKVADMLEKRVSNGVLKKKKFHIEYSLSPHYTFPFFRAS